MYPLMVAGGGSADEHSNDDMVESDVLQDTRVRNLALDSQVERSIKFLKKLGVPFTCLFSCLDVP